MATMVPFFVTQSSNPFVSGTVFSYLDADVAVIPDVGGGDDDAVTHN
jgi:hypothetical protein